MWEKRGTREAAEAIWMAHRAILEVVEGGMVSIRMRGLADRDMMEVGGKRRRDKAELDFRTSDGRGTSIIGMKYEIRLGSFLW